MFYLAMMLSAAAAPQPVAAFPNTFSEAFRARLAEDRGDKDFPKMTINIVVFLDLEIAAGTPGLCLDNEKERMWALAMRLTRDEDSVMHGLCLAYMKGSQDELKSQMDRR